MAVVTISINNFSELIFKPSLLVITLNMLKTKLSVFHNRLFSQMNRIHVAMFASLILHITILFGVTFKFPAPDFNRVATPLEVVMVNNQTLLEPTNTEILAQENLDGGGNTDDNRRAKTPFPVVPGNKPLRKDITTQQKVERLEAKSKKLMTAVENTQQINQSDTRESQSEQDQITTPNTTNLLQRSLDITRLKAQIAKDHDAYQKRPKRKFVGARTKEYRFARYVEDWRIKVERIGNLNYPEAARKGNLYGNLQLTVGIRADGSLESIGINRSSGEEVLDEAAIRIVRLAGQNGFAPFPPDISRDTDILHITRTWVFARSDTLLSE